MESDDGAGGRRRWFFRDVPAEAPSQREREIAIARRQLLLPVSDNYFCRRRVSEGVLVAT